MPSIRMNAVRRVYGVLFSKVDYWGDGGEEDNLVIKELFGIFYCSCF